MSELNAFNSERIYWALEQVEREAGDIDDLHLDDNLFYIKSEADKEIAELNARIADGDRDFDWAYNQNERLLKIVRHQKYKRCLAMAKWCENEEKRLEAIAPIFDTDKECWEYNSDYWYKWRKRWLELAEQFKEANG